MKNKKLLMSVLTPCAILVPAVSAVAITGCSNRPSSILTVEVGTYDEFISALSIKNIDVIKLTQDLTVPSFTSDTGLVINRSVTINGNNHKLTCTNTEDGTIEQATLIRIMNPTNGKSNKITVNFWNFNEIRFNSKSPYNAVIRIDDAEGSVTNFSNTKIVSGYEQGTYNRCYGLSIRANIKAGCTVNFKNNCQIEAWGCVYNLGSHVTFNANKTIFTGHNPYPYAQATNHFATITVSDYPFLANHSNSCSNTFTFSQCEIKAETVATGEAQADHQFLIQNRCPANNVVKLDSSTISGSTGILNAHWFATATDDEADITDANIQEYLTRPSHGDMPGSGLITDRASYYNYYSVESNTLSRVYINGVLSDGDESHPGCHVRFYTIDTNHKWVPQY